MRDVFALGNCLHGRAENIDQAVVNPRGIITARLDFHHLVVDRAAITCCDALTFELQGVGVALSLRATCCGQTIDYLVDGDGAKIDFFVRD